MCVQTTAAFKQFVQPVFGTAAVKGIVFLSRMRNGPGCAVIANLHIGIEYPPQRGKEVFPAPAQGAALRRSIVDDPGRHIIIPHQRFPFRLAQARRNVMALQNAIPHSPAFLCAQTAEMNAEGKTSAHGLIDMFDVIGYPDDSLTGLFQKIIEPCLVLGLTTEDQICFKHAFSLVHQHEGSG